MRFNPKFKVLIEGVEVQASSIIRQQREGSPATCDITIWPSADAFEINRGSHVTVFWKEQNQDLLRRQYPDIARTVPRDGVWKLFFDGYVVHKPKIVKQRNSEVRLQCASFILRLDDVRLIASSLTAASNVQYRDRAFYGTNPRSRSVFNQVQIDGAGNAISQIQEQMGSNGVAQTLVNLVHQAADYDEMFARVHAASRMRDRVNFLDNEATRVLVEQNNLISVLTNSIGSLPAATSLWQIINNILHATMYMVTSQSSPALIDGSLRQILYRPQLFFSVPPKCNIIFPANMISIQSEEPYGNRPTRMVMTSYMRMYGENHAGSPFANRLYYPAEIGAGLSLSEFSLDTYGSLPLTDRFTEEELLQDRVTPTRQEMPFNEALFLQEGSEENLARSYGGYYYHMARNTTDNVRASTSFDPYLLHGFPGVIFDDHLGMVMGRIQYVMDSIDLRNSRYETTLEMTNVRIAGGIRNGRAVLLDNDDALTIEGYDNIFGVPPDGFFDDTYRDESIGESLYLPEFGVDSVVNTNDAFYRAFYKSGVPEANLRAASLAGIYRTYRETADTDQHKFVEEVKFRPIVSEGEYMDFLGAVPEQNPSAGDTTPQAFRTSDRYAAQYELESEGYPAGDEDSRIKPFMKERQEKVKTYVNNLRAAFFTDIA